MSPVEFEPTISAGERPQTYALDRAAIGTGYKIVWNRKIIFIFIFLQFYTGIDTTVQTNDEISLYFKPMRLIFMNYSV
jgi:hypothetical protein